MAMGLNAARRGRRGRGRTPMAEINVTPLVDVMLVLLIIFMVTAPLLTAGVPVDLPDSAAQPVDQDREQVVLSIDRDGAIFLDDRPVAEGTLARELDAIAGGAEPPPVTLRADKALDYGRVMAVMGRLNAAGFNRIALVTVAAGSGTGP